MSLTLNTKTTIDMIVLIDNGHGKETPGKRSPVWADGSQLFEYEFNRDIAKRLNQKLEYARIPSALIVPLDYDTPLKERVRRVNKIASSEANCILISIHANAGGGTGWEVFTTKGETESDVIAEYFVESARKNLPQFILRADYTDGDGDKEEQFYIIRKTICPAVLTENLFMDTESDCRFIMSDHGREVIAHVHFDAIISYLQNKFNYGKK